MPQPILDLSGETSAPVLHIAPANGFVPQTYIPMLNLLIADYRAICLPPRALWDDETPPPVTPENDWRMTAHDLLAGLEQYQLNDVIAVGHSFGGIASILAVLQQPERFKALILLDPTILPPHMLEMIRHLQNSDDKTLKSPMAQMAERRRNSFESKDAAFARFREKPLFKQWSDDVLRLYTEHGLTSTNSSENLDEVTLTWSPQWEAFYFDTVYTKVWEKLPDLAEMLPTLIIQGSTTDTYMDEAAQRVQTMLPDATHLQLPGHGHLFPQSAPEETATMIQNWLNTLSD